MQGLNAAPRDSFTVSQITNLLTADEITVTPGLELLDSNNNFVSDISDDMLSGTVDRNCNADVHGTIKLQLSRLLAWGKDRVRPYMILTDGLISARFNLGVFVLTTPNQIRSEDPITFDVAGYDLLHLLQDGPGDTYVVASGTTYLAAIQAVLTASGVGATVTLDGTRSATTLSSPMVWALDPQSATSWLRIVNDLLGAINYRSLWVDQDGTFRSSPYVTPSARAVEWTFDTDDPRTNLIEEPRSLASDVWGARNWWRFVRKGMTVQPVEGAGIYTVSNVSTGRTSQAALGRTVRAPVQFLDAADQASLVSQGDQIVTSDQSVSRIFQVSIGPFPIASHFDVVQFNDAGDSDKCQVSSWSIPLDGSGGAWQLEAVSA